jgi:hypothetical protein
MHGTSTATAVFNAKAKPFPLLVGHPALQCSASAFKLTRILLTLLFHAMQAGRAAPEHRRNAETL